MGAEVRCKPAAKEEAAGVAAAEGHVQVDEVSRAEEGSDLADGEVAIVVACVALLEEAVGVRDAQLGRLRVVVGVRAQHLSDGAHEVAEGDLRTAGGAPSSGQWRSAAPSCIEWRSTALSGHNGDSSGHNGDAAALGSRQRHPEAARLSPPREKPNGGAEARRGSCGSATLVPCARLSVEPARAAVEQCVENMNETRSCAVHSFCSSALSSTYAREGHRSAQALSLRKGERGRVGARAERRAEHLGEAGKVWHGFGFDVDAAGLIDMHRLDELLGRCVDAPRLAHLPEVARSNQKQPEAIISNHKQSEAVQTRHA